MKYNIKYCDKCSLGIFNGFIPVSGSGEGTDIMIIGDTPGGTEVKKGSVFVGKAGKLLRKLLIKRNLIQYTYFTNAVKCKPPSNRTPRTNEMQSCKGFLLKEISEAKPKIIILLGLTAIQSIYPTERYVKSKAYTYNTFGKIIIGCIYHPNFLLKNKQELPKYEAFFDKLSDIYSIINPYYFKR